MVFALFMNEYPITGSFAMHLHVVTGICSGIWLEMYSFLLVFNTACVALNM